MRWRFRHSYKVFPGLKLNLSKSGLSASIGGAPFTVNVAHRGIHKTASLPGTGLSFQQNFTPRSSLPPQPDRSKGSSARSFPTFVNTPQNSELTGGLVNECRSGSTDALTSDGLKILKPLLEAVYDERQNIRSVLAT